jgi:hypothetical protein
VFITKASRVKTKVKYLFDNPPIRRCHIVTLLLKRAYHPNRIAIEICWSVTTAKFNFESRNCNEVVRRNVQTETRTKLYEMTPFVTCIIGVKWYITLIAWKTDGILRIRYKDSRNILLRILKSTVLLMRSPEMETAPVIFRNVGIYLRTHTTSQARKTSSFSPPWEPQNSQVLKSQTVSPVNMALCYLSP